MGSEMGIRDRSYIYLFVPSTDNGSFGFNEHTPYALGFSSDVTTPGSRPLLAPWPNSFYRGLIYEIYGVQAWKRVPRLVGRESPSLTAAVHLPCPILRHPRSGVSPFRFLSTAQQSSPAVRFCTNHVARGSSPTMDHAHFTIDTFLIQLHYCAAGLMCRVKATSSIQPHRARRNQITSVSSFLTPLRAGDLLLP